MEAIERLLHNIENDLQVIRMEAVLLKKSTPEQIPQNVLEATQDIQKLLEEVRQYFILPK
jgi:hypothetical protein